MWESELSASACPLKEHNFVFVFEGASNQKLPFRKYKILPYLENEENDQNFLKKQPFQQKKTEMSRKF